MPAIEAHEPELAGTLCAAHVANAQRSPVRRFSAPIAIPTDLVSPGKVTSNGFLNLQRNNLSSLPTGEIE